jgi:hypothetical protein
MRALSHQTRAGCAPRRPSMRGTTAPSQPHRRALRVCASEGVQDLLARDRKRKQDQAPEVNEFDMPGEVAAPAPAPAAGDTGGAVAAAAADAERGGSGRAGGRAGRLKSRQQRRKDMAVNDASAAGQG